MMATVHRARWFCVGLLFTSLGCAAQSPAVAPAAAPTSGTPKASAAPRYLVASQADIVALLPPPPALNSPAQRDDLAAVLAAQHQAHADGSTAHAVADAQASCGRFADAAGTALSAPQNSAILAFLDEAAREGATVAGPAKLYWQRLRPYAYSGQVERLADVAPDDKQPPALNTGSDTPAPPRAGDPQAHASYPSGHATFGTLCAIMLADMVPERRAQIFARNLDYGHSRLVVGAHYPSDIEAGRIAGTVATQLLLQNPAFQRDFAQARAALRAALGLPADAPVAAVN